MNLNLLALWGALALGRSPQGLTLDQALGLARLNRSTVRAAELRLEQARLQRRSLGAPLPTRLDLQATTDRNLYGNDDDVVLAQPIDLFGRRKAGRGLGDAQVRLAEADLRQTRLDVQGDVIDRYAETAAAGQLAQTAAAQLELAERLVAATRQRADGGVAPPIQVRRAALEAERARQTVRLRQAAFEASRRRLAGALGVEADRIGADRIGADRIGALDFPQAPTVPVDGPTLARQRADLLRLSALEAVAQASAAVSRLQFRPDFEISARTSPYSYGSQRPTGIRATLSIPIFDHGKARNDVRAAQAGADAERKAREDATARARAELEAVELELAAANEQRASFGRILAEGRELVRVSEVGYREGATTLLEVIEATRALREVEESIVESRLRVARAQSAFLRTSGTLLEGAGR